MKQRFTDHDQIPIWLEDYILTVADALLITDISIEDINGFLAGLDDFHENKHYENKERYHDATMASDTAARVR